MSSCRKVSWFFRMCLCILKTYMDWSIYIYVLKMWGFFFLYCVWINEFYSLLDFRVAYASANLVHILLPQHLLYAYCHININAKNVSHDSCTACCVNEQVSVLAMIMDWCCALHFYLFLCTLTSQRSENRHPPLCLGMQSHECLRSAEFSSAVKTLNSTFCDTASPLRQRSFSTGHSDSIEVKPEICMDLPIYNQVAYE